MIPIYTIMIMRSSVRMHEQNLVKPRFGVESPSGDVTAATERDFGIKNRAAFHSSRTLCSKTILDEEAHQPTIAITNGQWSVLSTMQDTINISVPLPGAPTGKFTTYQSLLGSESTSTKMGQEALSTNQFHRFQGLPTGWNS